VESTRITKLIRENCNSIGTVLSELANSITGTLLINGSIIKYLIITIVRTTMIRFCHLIS
jgi:hypothetical protein